MELALIERIQKIKAVITDIDGVLTDGCIVLGNYGDELKFFDAQDGLGFALLGRAGLKTIMMTARKSRINQKRAKEIEAFKLYQNVSDKLRVFQKVSRKLKLAPEEICVVGDDLLDIPPMRQAGFAVAVANAVEETKHAAHYVTLKSGGRGAIRELSELLLKNQGKWSAVTARYVNQ